MTSGERHLIIWNVSILVYSELGTLGAPFESFKGLWGWGSAVSDLHGSHSNCTSISLLRHAWGKLERNVIILLILFNVFMGDIISHFVISTTHFYTSSKLLSPITSPTGHATSSFSWTDDAPPNAGILPQRPERRVVMRHKIWVNNMFLMGLAEVQRESLESFCCDVSILHYGHTCKELLLLNIKHVKNHRKSSSVPSACVSFLTNMSHLGVNVIILLHPIQHLKSETWTYISTGRLRFRSWTWPSCPWPKGESTGGMIRATTPKKMGFRIGECSLNSNDISSWR